MVPTPPPAGSRIGPVIAIAAIALVPAGPMFLVTTFLFAFSSSQGRMVPVVGYGALAMIGATALAAAIAWIVRSAPTAIKVAAITAVIGWFATVIVEFGLSIFLSS